MSINLTAITPELILTGTALLVLLLDLFIKRKELLTVVTLVGIAVTFWISTQLIGNEITTFNRMFTLDLFGIFFKMIFLISAALTVGVSARFLKLEGKHTGEYYVLLLASTLGMMVMSSGTDFLSIFLGLELMVLPIYILAGFVKGEAMSNEAGLKYLLLGTFSAGILLYGISLIYGITGSTNIFAIRDYLSANEGTSSYTLLFALTLLIAGFGFKIAAVPFHMWTPDAYEGAPTPITGFMSVGPKAAGFAALLRVFMIGLYPLQGDWLIYIAVMAVLTMTLGNFVAISQGNIKRMLAYSSIAHAGYILVGLAVASNPVKTEGLPDGLTSVLFYLFSYALMNIGAFAIIALVQKHHGGISIEGFNGLAQKKPGLAAAMVIFLLSLAGIPPTFGFVGKLYIFGAAIESGFTWLAIIGVLNAVVAAFYYFRVILNMYMKEPAGEFTFEPSRPMIIAISASAIATLLFGLYPRPIIELARQSILHLL
jgi:NADH-quinone oxidoreductase subunit N